MIVRNCDFGAVASQDFEFRGPVVGPLSGSQYLTTVSGFKITDAFSDLKPNLFGFQVDPFMPNRVYYISQASARPSALAPIVISLATYRLCEAWRTPRLLDPRLSRTRHGVNLSSHMPFTLHRPLILPHACPDLSS